MKDIRVKTTSYRNALELETKLKSTLSPDETLVTLLPLRTRQSGTETSFTVLIVYYAERTEEPKAPNFFERLTRRVRGGRENATNQKE